MPRTKPRDLSLALGCIEYEMHVLAMALLLRRDGLPRNQNFPEAVSELVASALLLKARSLVEFLTLRRNTERITLESFGIARKTDPALRRFQGFVSQHSVHLDWERARDPLVIRDANYEDAVYVLRECACACNQIQKSGVRLGPERHRKRHQVLRAQLALLGIKLA
jgi:hypothetical protein